MSLLGRKEGAVEALTRDRCHRGISEVHSSKKYLCLRSVKDTLLWVNYSDPGTTLKRYFVLVVEILRNTI